MRPLRILYVVPYVPSRRRPRPLHLVAGLAARGHRLVLCAAATSAAELDDVAALRASGVEVHVTRVPTIRSLGNSVGALLRGQPMQAAYCLSPRLTAAIRAALAASPGCDVVHVEHLRAARYGLAVPRPRVFDAVDCLSALHAQAADLGPTVFSRAAARAELAPTRRFEGALLRGFDRVLVSSDAERTRLLQAANGAGGEGRPVVALTNGVDTAHFAPRDGAREPATLVFAGRLTYHANLAALRWLLEAILPRIRAAHAAVRVAIVGADPPPRLQAWARRAGPQVEVVGTVADVRPHLARATVSVSPLPYAAGIQNKVLEAMAMATPVVASPAAAAGLRARHGTDLLVAGDSERFAAAVLHLLADPPAAARIGAAGRRYVCAQHAWPQVVAELEDVYREAIAAARPEG